MGKPSLEAMKKIIFIFLAFFLVGCVAQKNYDEFAKCLNEKGAKMYGAYWCPHCQNQKEAFGESWKYVNYIECSLPGDKGQTQECKDAGIEGYPTWVFAGGERVEGEASFKELSELTNCPLPK